jgi:hypothetical protein
LRYAADSNITSDGSGNLATSGTITLNNTKAIIGKEAGGTARNLLWVDATNQIALGQAGGGRFSFRATTGTELVGIDGNGKIIIGAVQGGFDGSASTLTTGLVKLLTGSITRIAKDGTFAVTTTPTLFNHSLGVVPDLVLVNITGALSVSRTCVVDYGTLSSTQVKLTGDGTMSVFTLSFKF